MSHTTKYNSTYISLVFFIILDSAISIATGYGLDTEGAGVQVHVIQTGSGTHPATYQWAPGVKWLGREADHSPPTSAEVKNMWIYAFTPPYIFMVWFLIS
jgi:hypothetical protein